MSQSEKIIWLLKYIGFILLVFIFISGILGGFQYTYFPRKDMVGNSNIINSCNDMGGVSEWVEWQQGCSDKKCYFMSCVILSEELSTWRDITCRSGMIVVEPLIPRPKIVSELCEYSDSYMSKHPEIKDKYFIE